MNLFPQPAMLAVCVVLAACAGRAAPPPAAAAQEPAAAAHDHAAAHGGMQHAPVIAGVTPADVRFMQDMIGHHAQALTMAVMAPTHGAAELVLRLAEKIDISQRDEIALMEAWLTERGQPLPGAHHAHAMHMPGMLTAEQLAQLDAARGPEFDRLFLTLMIQHHVGALEMVETLFASPGAAQDSDLFRFATDVEADQRDEIDVMYRMLELLAANRGSE